jgi:glutamyl-tRNA reductase
MPIVVYGMSHATAPLAVREKIAFPGAELSSAVARLVRAGGVVEGLILSTCNRTEMLVAMEPAESAGDALRRFLAGERSVAEEELERHCYLHSEREAVRHVFRTAASLDSMVVGEAQILGQVKEAYAAAAKAGALGTILNTLMQRSFAVAKRVRTETGIARHPVSIAHAAAGLARDIFGDLHERTILIVGAGKMARLAARNLIGDGVRSVVVASRSYQRASDLARELEGRAAPFDRLVEEMSRADVVIASTAAPHHVVGYEDVQRVSRARRGRPVFLVDIALPRNIDPRVNEIDNVYLYDLDDLLGVVRANLGGRLHEAAAAEAIVEREVESYLAWRRSQEVTPTIVELRGRLHAIGSEELTRFRGRLGALGPEQRKAVEELTTSLVNKLLHHPIQALKRAAASNGGGARVGHVREIFGLDPSRATEGIEPACDAPHEADRGPEEPVSSR